MKRSVLRSTLVWSVLLAMGCSGGTGGCGGCTGAIPGGFPAAQRQANAITARLSPDGLTYFQNNLTNLISLVNKSGLTINVPCINASQKVLGFTVPVYACDLNPQFSCPAGSGGPGVPSSNGIPQCQAQAAINSATITPSNASDGSVNVAVSLQMTVNTGDIPVDVHIPLIGDVQCRVSYDTGNATFPVNVTLDLKVDPNWGNILGFNVMGIDLTQLIQANDLNINGGFPCNVLDIGFIKGTLVNLVTGLVNSKVGGIIDGFRCQACDSAGMCPTSPTDPTIVSTCDASSKLCYVDVNAHVCPPKELGIEGRVGVGTFLSAFGGSPDAKLDLYAVAGGVNADGTSTTKTDATGGLVLGIMGGTNSPSLSPCVPMLQPPTFPTPDPIDFDVAAMEAGLPPVTSYHAGLGVAGNFINKALFDVYASGTLCLNIDSSVSSFLSSSLFSTFLPSLGLLTHGQNAPLLIALRPKNPPQVRIGLGSTKTVGTNTVPDDPLLTVSMTQVQLDFYAFIEERFVRLFSIETDLSLPLSLKFDPVAGTVQPVLAGLDTALANTQALNSEILAEDPSELANLLPKLIGLVQPLLGSVLKPIALPTFSGLKLQIDSARGAMPDSSGASYQHLALFAELDVGQHLTARADTQARLVESTIPPVADVKAGRADPVVVIEASGMGARSLAFKGYEYSYRIDGGLWYPYTRNARLQVKAPVLGLQGRHQIEVISREIGVGATEDDTPAVVGFVVDYEAPKVRLDFDSGSNTVRTVAQDAVWPESALSYRYRIGSAGWSSEGVAKPFTSDELGGQPLSVEVTDGSGHSAVAVYNQAPTVRAPGSKLPTAGSSHLVGCTQAPASAWMLLLLALWLVRRQRRA
jgi:hypothetical protein